MNPYNNTNILESIRKSRGFSRSIAMLVVLVLVGIVAERTIYYSLRNADVIEEENVVKRAELLAPHKVQQARQLARASAKSEQAELFEANQTEDLSSTVLDLQESLLGLENSLNQGVSEPQAWEALAEQRRALMAFDEQEMAAFAEIEANLIEHQLPEVIRQRHTETVETFRTEMDKLLQTLAAIEAADNDLVRYQLVKQANEQLAAKQLKRSQQPFDPNNLPTKSLRPDLRTVRG